MPAPKAVVQPAAKTGGCSGCRRRNRNHGCPPPLPAAATAGTAGASTSGSCTSSANTSSSTELVGADNAKDAEPDKGKPKDSGKGHMQDLLILSGDAGEHSGTCS